MDDFSVDTRRRFNVCKTSVRCLIDVETTLCVCWVSLGDYKVPTSFSDFDISDSQK